MKQLVTHARLDSLYSIIMGMVLSSSATPKYDSLASAESMIYSVHFFF